MRGNVEHCPVDGRVVGVVAARALRISVLAPSVVFQLCVGGRLPRATVPAVHVVLLQVPVMVWGIYTLCTAAVCSGLAFQGLFCTNVQSMHNVQSQRYALLRPLKRSV